MIFDYERLKHDPSYRRPLTEQVVWDDALREEGRQLAKTNLLALCYILGYTKIDPVVHAEALAFFPPRDLTKPVSRQGEGVLTKGTLLYPRATYKTTLDEADSVQDHLCFPADGILFFLCANQNLADALVANAGGHFIKPRSAMPTLLQALFPELCVSDPKAADGGRFYGAQRQTQPPIKEAAFMGWSVESGVSGWHCWRLKCDDMANNRNMKSESSQADVWKGYGINRKMLNPGGIEDKLGTRYGPFDPYGREIAASRPGSYRYIVKPALRLRNGERLDANGFPPREDVELLFEPLGLTYEFLRDEYDADYSSFMTQYMNDSFGSNEVTFSHDLMMGAIKPEAQMPLDVELEIRWRLPHRAAGWTSAAAIVGASDGLRMHLIDGVQGTFKPSQLAQKIVQLARKYDLHRITIEDSPGARRIEPAVKNYALTLGYPLGIGWAEYAADESERDLRIKTLETVMLAGRLVISDELPVLKKVFDQFTNYGITAENALPDIASRLCESLPATIANTAETLEDGLAREMLLQRDHWNAVYGAGPYAEREEEPALPEFLDEEPELRNPWGLDDIMPGLNA